MIKLSQKQLLSKIIVSQLKHSNRNTLNELKLKKKFQQKKNLIYVYIHHLIFDGTVVVAGNFPGIVESLLDNISKSVPRQLCKMA